MATKQIESLFFPRWYRQITYAWKNVYHDICLHKLAAILTILVIAISITLPIVCYLLWKNVNSIAKQWSPSPHLTVYLKKTLDKSQVEQLSTEMTHLPAVKSIEYHSKKQNIEEFKVWSGFSDTLDLLDDNPLPDLFIIIPNNVSKDTVVLHELRETLLSLSGIDDVRLNDSWFIRLTALTGLVSAIVWALSFLMLIAVSLVIGNSIRLMIFARRQTIMVMQLIGATEGFILRPFLYNGMLYSFISVVLALILSEIFIFRVDSIILEVSSVFDTKFMLYGLSWEECASIILLVTLVGWLSAWLATKKYLQVVEK